MNIHRNFFLLIVTLFVGLTISAKDGVVRFAYLADLHISEASPPSLDLENSVNDINLMTDIDFVILAGDITEFGSDVEIERAKSILDKLNVPYYIVAGNHDSKWSESGCNTFAKVFGYEHFNFDVDGIQFIGCNSGPNMRMAPALVPRESIVWLDSITKALPKDKPVIFINHYPLDDAMLNYRNVLDLIARTNIQVALCGHGHNNRILDYPGVAGVRNAITGVMGRSNLSGNKVAAGYNIITVTPGDRKNTAGSITFQERTKGVTKAPWHTMLLKNAPEKVIPVEALKPAIVPSSASGTPCCSGTAAYAKPDQPVKTIWEIQDNSDIGAGAVLGKGQFGVGTKRHKSGISGIVYYANTAGVVKALEAASGKLLWSYSTSGKIFSTPAVSDGHLVVGSSDSYIYCLDALLGKLIWKVKANKSVLASPTIYKGIVYIGSSDGIFRAIELGTGELVWSYDKIKGFIEAKAYVDKDGVYIGDWASTLYAFNPKNGSLLWSWTNNKGRGLSPAAVWPVKANGRIFVVTPERMTHAIDASTGKEIWRAKGGREAIGLSADGSAIYVKTMQDTVIAFSTTESSVISSDVTSWTTTKSVTPPPAPVSQTITTVPTTVSNSYVLPKSLWRSFTGYGYEIAPSPITTADGLVFIPTDKGNIFALNAKDGTVAWQYNFSIALINYILPIGHRQLLVTSMDGKVAILEY
ncbi:MAG: PQQ-binding-like beta-propeller repeat protein [Bacteroidales bacterium]|jgi:outer membrane protein assembly factor BamB/predicted phosphodiesterase